MPFETARAEVSNARVTLESIEVEAGGGFCVYFNDGGLFMGHLIEVRGSLDGGCTTAGIVG